MAASAHKSHWTHHIKSNLPLGGLAKRFPMDLVLCDPAAIKFVKLNEKKQQLVVVCCYLFFSLWNWTTSKRSKGRRLKEKIPTECSKRCADNGTAARRRSGWNWIRSRSEIVRAACCCVFFEINSSRINSSDAAIGGPASQWIRRIYCMRVGWEVGRQEHNGVTAGWRARWQGPAGGCWLAGGQHTSTSTYTVVF